MTFQSTQPAIATQDGVIDLTLKQVVDNITTLISHKRTNISALSAIIEVQVETSSVAPVTSSSGKMQLITTKIANSTKSKRAMLDIIRSVHFNHLPKPSVRFTIDRIGSLARRCIFI